MMLGNSSSGQSREPEVVWPENVTETAIAASVDPPPPFPGASVLLTSPSGEESPSRRSPQGKRNKKRGTYLVCSHPIPLRTHARTPGRPRSPAVFHGVHDHPVRDRGGPAPGRVPRKVLQAPGIRARPRGGFRVPLPRNGRDGQRWDTSRHNIYLVDTIRQIR